MAERTEPGAAQEDGARAGEASGEGRTATAMADGVIEHGVPIPPRSQILAKWKLIVSRMAVGDSYLCASENESSALRWAIRAASYKGTTRKCREGWRVWRVE